MSFGASAAADPLGTLLDPFRYAFMLHALEAGGAVALITGVVGWFTVLRREAFAGHTLSVMSFPGASGAALLGIPVGWGYFVACTLAALVLRFGARSRPGFAAETALVGTVQAAGLALGLIALTANHSVGQDLEPLLFGSVVGISAGQVLGLTGVTVAAGLVLAIAGRPLLLASIDPALASLRGVPVGLLTGGFYVVLGLGVAAASQITGALLVFSLLIMPAGCAQQITARPARGLAVAVGLGLVFVGVSLELAYYTDHPIGFYVSSLALITYAALRVGGRRRRAGTGAGPTGRASDG